jgi:hypothetical protein
MRLLATVLILSVAVAMSVEKAHHRHEVQRRHHQREGGEAHGSPKDQLRNARHASKKHHKKVAKADEESDERFEQSTTKAKAKVGDWGGNNPRYSHQHMGYIPPLVVEQRDLKLKESPYRPEQIPGPADNRVLSKAAAAAMNARVWHEEQPPRPVGYVNPPSCKTFPFCWQVPSPPAMKPAYWESGSSTGGDDDDDSTTSSSSTGDGRPQALAYESPLGDVIDTHGPKTPTVLRDRSRDAEKAGGTDGDAADAAPAVPMSEQQIRVTTRKDLYENMDRLAGDNIQ